MTDIYPLGDDTGRAMLAAQQGAVAELAKLVLLKELEIGHSIDELTDWGEFASMVREGTAQIAFPAAETRLKVPWSTKATSTSEEVPYTAPVNVCHYGEGALADGEVVKVGHLQFHRCLPFDTQFSPYQAFLFAIDGLPAGTYNVTMGFSWGSNVVNGKTYQFTLANALPAGGQLAGFYTAPDASPTNWRVYAFASQTATTATETVTLSEGSGGTNLGTFTAAGVAVPASGTPETQSSVTVGGTTYAYYGLNSLHRVAYGNNRWLHSPLRQYLNSFGFDWWVPATVFDRPPAYAGRIGFLSGCPESMVEHMLPIARMTALNYITDGGTSGAPLYDTTYDLVTLPSGLEHFLQDTSSYGGAQGKEGESWEYWKRVAGSSTPLGWSTWGQTQTYHPEYVQYDLASPTTARNVWMRLAYRSYGGYVALVHSTGTCSNSTAVGGHRAAPACAIG